MKRLYFFITLLIFFIQAFLTTALAELEPVKVMSLHYDNASSLVYITTQNNNQEKLDNPIKFVRLSEPNRIYFNIDNAVLIGEKQQLIFEKSHIKEIRLAQFETTPTNIVRAVITFDEAFDTSKIKILNIDGNIIVKTSNLNISNDYFNVIYTDNPQFQPYLNIVANSQFIQKLAIPAQGITKAPESVMDDIQRAFENSLTEKTDENIHTSTVSVDLSSNLKLRTKYFINKYLSKNNGLLISGLGQLTSMPVFYLSEPTRAVIDLPNTYLARDIRNKEIQLCQDIACEDVAKIGQFEQNTARIVINSNKAKNYLPILSQDSQSLFIIDSEKLDHKALATNIANINKAFVRRIDSRTNELILSFSSPIVHSILRTDNSLNIFLFNVQSYNEQDIIKTLQDTYYSRFTLSLLPQIGVKGALEINKTDNIKIEQSLDAKALKITITKGLQDSILTQKPTKRGATKGKIVIDAGHGGSDYGAIREGINEKDITLDITQRLEAILRSKGYKVSLVRSDDTFVSLEDRVAFSEEEKPEVFISVHVNSSVSNDPSGIETHWYHDYSKNLAEIIHKHLIKQIPSSKDRGLFKSKFYVINHTTVPAVLCEIGFLSNPDERNELITENRKQRTAKAIADGIIEYLRGKK